MLAEGPKPEELTTAVEADRRSFESSQRTNGYALSEDLAFSHSRLLLDLWHWPSLSVMRFVHLTGRCRCCCVYIQVVAEPHPGRVSASPLLRRHWGHRTGQHIYTRPSPLALSRSSSVPPR